LDGAEKLDRVQTVEYKGDALDILRGAENGLRKAFNSAVIDSWNSGVDFFSSLGKGTLAKDLKAETNQIVTSIKDEAVASYKYHTTTSIGQQASDFADYLAQPERVEDLTQFWLGSRTPIGGFNKNPLKAPTAELPKKTTNKPVIEANGANASAARSNTATRTQSPSIQQKQATSRTSESIVKDRLNSQLASDEMLIVKPRFYIQKNGVETYTVPDFAIYNTSTKSFTRIIDAKNGNGGFTTNQSILSTEGGTFRGSSRYRDVPAQSVAPGKLVKETTSLPYQ
jgi:hypothetical protein